MGDFQLIRTPTGTSAWSVATAYCRSKYIARAALRSGTRRPTASMPNSAICSTESAEDPENRVVILTGTGDEFLTQLDVSTVGDINTHYWSRIYKEGKDLLQNLLDIEVPIIGAVNGPAFIHAELLTLSDIVIASDRAAFADKAHSPGGVVPADGVHVGGPCCSDPTARGTFC